MLHMTCKELSVLRLVVLQKYMYLPIIINQESVTYIIIKITNKLSSKGNLKNFSTQLFKTD